MVRLFFNGQSVLRLATAAPHLSRSIDDRLRLLPYNTRRKINKIPHDLPQPNPFFGFGVSLSFYELREDFFFWSVWRCHSPLMFLQCHDRKLGNEGKNSIIIIFLSAQYCPFSIISVREPNCDDRSTGGNPELYVMNFTPQNESIS